MSSRPAIKSKRSIILPLHYAGVGARETPSHVLRRMEVCAKRLREKDYVLRSGGAVGADYAWELGSHGRNHILRATDATPEAIELASQYHDFWHNCDPYVRKLHGRNAMIVLGNNLDEPVRFVACWTQGGHDVGGTGMAIRIAEAKRIPVFNFWEDDAEAKIKEFVLSHA